jgi:hypothetical protein
MPGEHDTDPEHERRRLHELSSYESKALIRAVVKETFLMLGLEVDDPIEMQRDFQHLRDWRTTSDSIKAKSITAVVGILASGLLAAAWLGLKESLGLKR